MTILCLLLTTAALGQPSNMTGGEISELHHSRAGHPAYINGFETQLNFVTLKEGAVTLTPGTFYVANTKNDDPVRLQKFVYAEDDVYMLEFGHQYCRFFRGHGQVAVISGDFTIIDPLDLIPPFGSESTAVYEISTTYDGNDLDGLSFYNSADTLYIDHPDYFPARLVRYATTNWILSDIDANDGPFLTQNVTNQTITPGAVDGIGIGLVASGNALWDASHVDSYWRISHVTDANTESGSITGTGAQTRTFIGTGATYTVNITGTFSATIALQQSFDGTTYQALRNVTAAEEITNNTDEPQFIRLNCTAYSSGTATWEIEVPSYTHNGVAQITAVADPLNATATVVSRLYEASATTRWAEGAWSTFRGFPSAVNFYAGRLIHGGTAWEPLRIWFSATPDIESHEPGANATDAFAYTISGARQSPIKWLEPRHGHGITIGTLGRIIEVQPIDTFSAISVTNPPTETASVAWTSGSVAPIQADNAMLVTDRGGRRIGELLSSSEEEGLVVSDITRFADHITYVESSAGLTDVDFQLRPEPILWAARSDGVMPAMTYDRLGRIGAWSRHTVGTGGFVEEVEVLPLATYDELWLVGKYTVDANTVRFVMYMDELDPRKTRDTFHYVHAGLIFDGGDEMTITGITQADPGVVTISGAFPSGFTNGHQVYFDDISGMVELNQQVFTIANINTGSLTFSLRTLDNTADLDTTVYTAYTADGNALWVENSFGNLDYVEGETLVAVNFGPYEGVEDVTVASGAVALSDYHNYVHIGYFDAATLVTTAFDTVETQDLLKQMDGAAITFFRTLFGDVGPDTSNLKAFQWDTEDDGTTALFTGDKIVDISGNLDHKTRVVIQQDEPWPMTIMGIRPRISVRGGF